MPLSAETPAPVMTRIRTEIGPRMMRIYFLAGELFA
jgi:hypothetical protein